MSLSSNTHTSPRSDVPTIPVGPSAADILRGAATYLQRHGWTQGQFYADLHSPSPKADAFGAIGIVANCEVLENPLNEDNDDCMDAVELLRTYIAVRFDCDVDQWNDHPNRTRNEVIAALLDAANQ